MADIIIIALLGTAVFFILRSQLRRVRKGECTGGCSGCRGCSGCGGGHSGCGGGGSLSFSGRNGEDGRGRNDC